ncbi:MAG: hypothetical protein WAQ22_03410 [Candidatus Saccharimonas sp.]
MTKKILFLLVLISTVLLSALLQVTSPSDVHPIVILSVLVLLYVLVLGALTLLIIGLFAVIKRVIPKSQRSVTLDFKRSYYLASVLALGPVLLIGAQSIGRDSIYDVFLVIIFELVACFYIAKR